MNVWVNGERRALPRHSTVGAVVDSLGRGRQGVAAAVNEAVVPGSQWDQTLLSENDRVEFLTAAQGG